MKNFLKTLLLALILPRPPKTTKEDEMMNATMEIYNVDRMGCLPGGASCPWDFAIVLSKTETVPHPITGKDQPKRLFSGRLDECHDFVERQKASA